MRNSNNITKFNTLSLTERRVLTKLDLSDSMYYKRVYDEFYHDDDFELTPTRFVWNDLGNKLSQCQSLEMINFQKNYLGSQDEGYRNCVKDTLYPAGLTAISAVSLIAGAAYLQKAISDNAISKLPIHKTIVFAAGLLLFGGTEFGTFATITFLSDIWTFNPIVTFGSSLMKCPTLTTLDLSFNQLIKLSVEGWSDLGNALVKCPNLQQVDISNNDLDQHNDTTIHNFMMAFIQPFMKMHVEILGVDRKIIAKAKSELEIKKNAHTFFTVSRQPHFLISPKTQFPDNLSIKITSLTGIYEGHNEKECNDIARKQFKEAASQLKQDENIEQTPYRGNETFRY